MNNIADVLTGRTKQFSSQLNTLTQVTHIEQPYHQEEHKKSDKMDIHSIKRMLLGMKEQIESVLHVLNTDTAVEVAQMNQQSPRMTHTDVTPVPTYETPSYPAGTIEAKIIEGVFDGEQMIGSDGHAYPVPPNYASKSKMVEGDILKLTITEAGARYYKQIGPVARITVTGELMQDPGGAWVVLVGHIPYKLLTASVTFHRVRPGDRVSILVPAAGGATWGAFDMVERVEKPITY